MLNGCLTGRTLSSKRCVLAAQRIDSRAPRARRRRPLCWQRVRSSGRSDWSREGDVAEAEPLESQSEAEVAPAAAAADADLVVPAAPRRLSLGSGQAEVFRGLQSVLSDNTHTYLALFLILLTFFIGLTANAQFDVGRVGAVVHSVQSSFGTQGRASEKPRSGQQIGGLVWFSDDHANAADPDTVAAFRHVLEPLMADGGALVENSDGRVFARVPAEALFIGGSGAVRRDRAGLFAELGGLLAGDGQTAGRRLAVEVTAADGDLGLARAAAIGRWVQQPGVPAVAISVGVDPTADGDVRFEIYRAGRSGA